MGKGKKSERSSCPDGVLDRDNCSPELMQGCGIRAVCQRREAQAVDQFASLPKLLATRQGGGQVIPVVRSGSVELPFLAYRR